jgi:hypothetical protein
MRWIVAAWLLVGCSTDSATHKATTDMNLCVGAGLPEIAFEIGNTYFAPGDEIRIERVRGDRPRIEPGGTYRVEGRWRLASRPEAGLALYATNGTVEGCNSQWVYRGEGRFALAIRLVESGDLHLTYYGDSHAIGGTYFGQGAGVNRGSYFPGRP